MAAPYFLNNQNLRMLLFGGKRGVGKSTCAAATALRFARQMITLLHLPKTLSAYPLWGIPLYPQEISDQWLPEKFWEDAEDLASLTALPFRTDAPQISANSRPLTPQAIRPGDLPPPEKAHLFSGDRCGSKKTTIYRQPACEHEIMPKIKKGREHTNHLHGEGVPHVKSVIQRD